MFPLGDDANKTQTTLKSDNKNHMLEIVPNSNFTLHTPTASKEAFRVGPIYSFTMLNFYASILICVSPRFFPLSFFLFLAISLVFFTENNTMQLHFAWIMRLKLNNKMYKLHFVSINFNLHGINRNEHFWRANVCIRVAHVRPSFNMLICNSPLFTLILIKSKYDH